MTREEAIKGLASLLEVRRKYVDMQTVKDEIECLEMAIKALEQEPIFDKIRDEVLEYIDDLDIAAEICDIFDKYKAESK